MGTIETYDVKEDRASRDRAMDAFVEKARRDSQIIACFFYGSTVRGDFWAHSDIDVMLITTDENVRMQQFVLVEDGHWFETFMFSRSLFRQLCEGMTTGVGPASMRHSGKLAYCSDSSLQKFFSKDNRLGTYEKACRLFTEGAWWHFYMQKLTKYCGQGKPKRAYMLLGYMVNRYAALVILSKGIIPEREVLEQAAELEPELMDRYSKIVYSAMPPVDVIFESANMMARYVQENLHGIFGLLLDFLKDEGRMTPLSVIHQRFSQVLNNKNIELTFGACELLVDNGLAAKGVADIRLTKRSTRSFAEPAYMHKEALA